MRKPELLSPAGDFECLKAAVQNGANSVYFGSTLFSARASAGNFDNEQLKNAIQYCKLRNVKTNLTLNILIKNDEFEDAVKLAKYAYECGIDAIIVQDLGLARFLIKNIPDLPIHASTQMTAHNLDGVLELEKIGFKRVVLSRELSIDEIEYICNNSNVEIEVFVHGALCISYSGECLASSFIGGRSGNRGRCAQTCRLPYTLIKSNNKIETKLDTGYLLSTKDLCSLELLPRLIKAGVTCFKIEGRMKPPKYVATVTRIYRKYIDIVESNCQFLVSEKDKKDLLQVFNRGGFSLGHLKSSGNRSLIYPSKPNNMGLFLGTISDFNLNKGHITLNLQEEIAIGDTISIESENGTYTISEIISNKKTLFSARANEKVTLGRMKGKFKNGLKVFKMSSKEQDTFAQTSYLNIENKKIPLKCDIQIHLNKPVKMHISCINFEDSFYNDINFDITTDIIPQKALNTPITEDRIKSQIMKTNNTPYEFKNIAIHLDDNLYIPHISDINKLRRDALAKLENIIISKYCRKEVNLNNLSVIQTKNDNFTNKYSILLNNLNIGDNYSLLQNIDRVYIPLKFFLNSNYKEILINISKSFELYIYLPTIMRDNYKKLLNLNIEKILNTYKVKGFVISNLGNLEMLNKYITQYDFIANYTLNVFNDITTNELINLGISTITLSPELNESDFNNFTKSYQTELIVYSNIPVMNMNYCLLGKSNKCLKECSHPCSSNNKFYLLDRLGYKFEVVPDSIDGIQTIYNSKILSINPPETSLCNFRLDFLNETVSQINEIVKSIKSGCKLEGSNFTNGNWHREV